MKIPTFLFLLLFAVQLQAQTSILSTDFQTGIPSNYTLLNLDAQAPHPQVLEFASGWITTPDPENSADTVAAVVPILKTPIPPIAGSSHLHSHSEASVISSIGRPNLTTPLIQTTTSF